jgi:hypothetical protein
VDVELSSSIGGHTVALDITERGLNVVDNVAVLLLHRADSAHYDSHSGVKSPQLFPLVMSTHALKLLLEREGPSHWTV